MVVMVSLCVQLIGCIPMVSCVHLNARFNALFIAFRFDSSLGCTYTFSVVLMSLCPSSDDTVFTSTLFSMSVVANVWYIK